MTKLMSKREMALFKVAMNSVHAYQEAIGAHDSVENVAKTVARRTGFEWDEDDIAECCENIIGS